jgi:hypothetical protein
LQNRGPGNRCGGRSRLPPCRHAMASGQVTRGRAAGADCSEARIVARRPAVPSAVTPPGCKMDAGDDQQSTDQVIHTDGFAEDEEGQ